MDGESEKRQDIIACNEKAKKDNQKIETRLQGDFVSFDAWSVAREGHINGYCTRRVYD